MNGFNELEGGENERKKRAKERIFLNLTRSSELRQMVRSPALAADLILNRILLSTSGRGFSVIFPVVNLMLFGLIQFNSIQFNQCISQFAHH